MEKLTCPRCKSTQIVRNGKKTYGVQNYLCKKCKKQFIADNDRKYKGTIAGSVNAILKALVRGCGVRDIAVILEVRACSH